MAGSKIIGALEIGTSKISVLVAEVIDAYRLNIIGRATVANTGIKKGRIEDPRAVSRCLHEAIAEAEKVSGINLKSIYLSISGSHLQGRKQIGKAQISHMAKLVTEHDVNRANEEAKRHAIDEGRVYVQFMRNPYLIDGSPVDEPYSCKGSEIQANYWAVDADEGILKEPIQVINSFMVKVDEIFLGSIASAQSVATDDEKAAGLLVIDIGAGTTDYVLYHDRYVLQTGVFDIGGDHITNDLSIAFRIAWESAENIKIQHGKAIASGTSSEDWVWMMGDLSIGDRKLPLRSIQRIINSRLEELFMMVRRSVIDVIEQQDMQCKVVLCGGVTNMTSIETLASNVLKMPVTVGRNPDWLIPELQKPELSTVVGLLQFAFADASGDIKDEPKSKGGLLGKVSSFLTR